MINKNNINVLLDVFLIVLCLDLFCFAWWSLSGQVAPDNFHIGIISESIVKLFI